MYESEKTFLKLLPSLPEGCIRVFRGEPAKTPDCTGALEKTFTSASLASELLQSDEDLSQVVGGWYTPDLYTALQYAFEDRDDGKLFYLDLPKDGPFILTSIEASDRSIPAVIVTDASTLGKRVDLARQLQSFKNDQSKSLLEVIEEDRTYTDPDHDYTICGWDGPPEP